LKVVEHVTGRAIITGRDNGQLSLLSVEPARFGHRLAQFVPSSTPTSGLDDTSQQTAEQETINSLDVLESASGNLIAAATKSVVRVYGLPEEDASEVTPLNTYDLRNGVFTSSSARLCHAKWMEGGKSLALALTGCSDPLRYLELTPSGWTHHTAAKNVDLERQFDIKFDRTICPNSLEPVYRHGGSRGGTSLLLSAWRDGTCRQVACQRQEQGCAVGLIICYRLQDLRTPSPFDAVYQDNVDPWSDAEALMAYGTERFVVGGGQGVTVKVFDFRWTKRYYHTSGLSCLDRTPFPPPHQPFLRPPTTELRGRALCDHARGLSCHWHDLSRRVYYRPNSKYFLANSLRAFSGSSIWSMAKATDMSPNFYIGISGGVIEANLEPCPDTYPPDTATADSNFGVEDWRAAAPPESGYKSRALIPSMMEIGDGYAFKGNDRSIVLPRLLTFQGPRDWSESNGDLRKHHRLDIGYQDVTKGAKSSMPDVGRVSQNLWYRMQS
jgi:hypothetical protein